MDIQNSCIGVKKDCGKIVTFVRYCSPHFSLLSYFFILLGYEGMFYCISVSLKVANIFSLIWCNINYLNKNLVNNTYTWWIIPVLQSHSSVQSLSTRQTSGLESSSTQLILLLYFLKISQPYAITTIAPTAGHWCNLYLLSFKLEHISVILHWPKILYSP